MSQKSAHPILISQQCVGSRATEGYFRSLYIFHCIWVKPIPQLLWVHDQHRNGGNIEMSCNVLNWAFNSSVRSPYTAGPMISEHPKFSTGNSMLRMLWGPPPTALRSARRTSPVAVSCWNFDQRASLLSQKQSQKGTRQENVQKFPTKNFWTWNSTPLRSESRHPKWMWRLGKKSPIPPAAVSSGGVLADSPTAIALRKAAWAFWAWLGRPLAYALASGKLTSWGW